MRDLIFLAVWAVIFSSGIFFTGPGNVSAQTDKPKGVREIHITADSMTSERDRAFVTFTGNAQAKGEDIVIKANSIDVFFYTKDEKKSRAKNEDQQIDQDDNQSVNENIREIVATGNVIFTSEEHRASADRAVYTTKSERLVLTGDAPRVTTGKSYVTGKKITLFQKNGKVIVESGKDQRVEALFNDSDSESGKETVKEKEPDTQSNIQSATEKDKGLE